MQTLINKALRFINYNEEEEGRAEELHIEYNITPLNIKIHQRAKKIWETVRATEPEHYNKLVEAHNTEHKWFPKTSTII